MTRHVARGLAGLGERLSVRPAQRPVAIDARVDEAARAAAAQRRTRPRGAVIVVLASQPPVATTPSRTSTAIRTRSPPRSSMLVEDLGLRERDRPDHDPVGARADRVEHRLDRPQPAAELHRHSGARRDPLEVLRG